IIGRDGRPSGKWIEQIIAGVIAASGRDCELLGIVPTPTVQLAVEHSDSAGGIAITASHNPTEYNGLKFIGSNGVFLDAAENQNMWQIADSGIFDYASATGAGRIHRAESPDIMHINNILNLPIFENNDIIEKIRSRRLKVVVDAVNASGSVFMPALLRELGCEVVELYCNLSGHFPHTPEPLPENLGDMARAVIEHRADIGIAVDPDADRLVMIDQNGKPIGEEKTIVIAIDSALAALGSNDSTVAVNYSTSRMVDDVAAKYGAKVFRSPVGEINVVRKMKECGAVIGGEGSGGVILPASHYGRDSLVGAALTLALIARRGESLGLIASSYPDYSMIKRKRQFVGEIAPLLKKIELEFSDGQATIDDGIKINFEKSWVQLRASNTEPIVRIIAESPSREETEKLIARAETVIH
ncbi:MAG: phosphoglucosamine mutase, partial [Bacteroidota bacterium]